jgi:hypothetical protein
MRNANGIIQPLGAEENKIFCQAGISPLTTTNTMKPMIRAANIRPLIGLLYCAGYFAGDSRKPALGSGVVADQQYHDHAEPVITFHVVSPSINLPLNLNPQKRCHKHDNQERSPLENRPFALRRMSEPVERARYQSSAHFVPSQNSGWPLAAQRNQGPTPLPPGLT